MKPSSYRDLFFENLLGFIEKFLSILRQIPHNFECEGDGQSEGEGEGQSEGEGEGQSEGEGESESEGDDGEGASEGTLKY